jgi:hypothetical protein
MVRSHEVIARDSDKTTDALSYKKTHDLSLSVQGTANTTHVATDASSVQATAKPSATVAS